MAACRKGRAWGPLLIPVFCLAALTPGGIAAGSEGMGTPQPSRDGYTGESHPYWVFFRPPSREEMAKAPIAISPRAIRRMAKLARTPGADPLDLAITEEEIAPLRERGIVPRHLSRWLRAASAVMSGGQARAVASDPRVLSVRPVARFVRDADRAPVLSVAEQSAPAALRARDWGDPALTDPRTFSGADYGAAWEQLEMLGVPELHALGYSGRGVMVALFDTGFYKTHECLSGLQIAAERDFACGDDETQYQPGETCLPRSADNHGTYVWSALGGFAPGRLLGAAYRASFVLARTEEIGHEVHMEEDHYIAALEWADSLGVDIVSTSLGYRRFTDGSSYTIDQLDGRTLPITQATAIAARRGILVVTAMGNDGPAASSLTAPADGESVLAIGAVDFAGAVASFSGRGPTGDGRTKPDVMAAGISTACALAETPGTYGRVGGTSLATPLIAGMAALLLECHPSWTPDSLITRIRASGDHSGLPNSVSGWGIPDGLRAIRSDGPRLRVDETVWIDGSGSAGDPEWGQRGRLLVWFRNEGSSASPEESVRVGSRDDRLHPIGEPAAILDPISPGERDSVGVPLQIDNDDEFDLASLFLEIGGGGDRTERKTTFAIPRPYTSASFSATPDLTGAVSLAWQVQLLEITSLGGVSYRLYREEPDGGLAPLQDGNLDWWVHGWTDRPPGPGLYRYWLAIKIRDGLFVALEGPRDAMVPRPGQAAIGRAYPNPVRGGIVSIPLAWARTEDPEIEIFDVAGRRVRVLSGKSSEDGFPILGWDLADAAGHPVSSGLYLLHLSGGGSARVIVVR